VCTSEKERERERQNEIYRDNVREREKARQDFSLRLHPYTLNPRCPTFNPNPQPWKASNAKQQKAAGASDSPGPS
jgi:hypothetical protein